MSASEWISILGIVLAQVIIIVGGWIKAGKDTDAAIAGLAKNMNESLAKIIESGHERTREVDRLFGELRGDFKALNAEAAIYWKKVAVDAGARIHRPHEEAKKMDALLDEYRDTIMTPERLEELKVRLRAKVLDMKPEEGEALEDIPERQRDAALMLHAEDQREQADPAKVVLIEAVNPKETDHGH